MEVIDLYDRNKRKLNKTFIRGKDRLSAGEYYLLEQVWIVNKDNEILLTQRNENKSYGGFWEPTTGHVKTKESDVSGALRELKEELGVVVGSEDLIYKKYIIVDNKIIDIWILNKNIKLDEIVMKIDEVTNVKYVSICEFKEMLQSGEIMQTLDYFLDVYSEMGWVEKGD